MKSFDPFSQFEPQGTLSHQPLNQAVDLHFQPAESEERVADEKRPTPHFYPLYGIVLLIVSAMAVQCFNLQVIAGSTNRSLAEGNSIRYFSTPADRGLIQDASGQTLAQNDRQLALSIDPQSLPNSKEGREETYRLLKEKAGISEETATYIEENRRKTPDPFAIKTKLTQEESLLYKEWFQGVDGILVQEIPIRKYADIPSLGHILGYVGLTSGEDVEKGFKPNQIIGKTGLEKTYNEFLLGTPGTVRAEINALGEVVRTLPGGLSTQAVTGSTLKLSLDARLQTIVADALKEELERRTAKFGPMEKLGASAVVINPKDGSVLAMVSLPDYPANQFSGGISRENYAALLNNPANPLLNRAIQGQFQPGSIVKPFLAAAALEEKTITPNFSVTTPEALYIGDFRFPDWKLHGTTNVRKAIAESNNIFFYALGGGWKEKNIQGLGVERLNHWYRQFGIGSTTGIDIPGELSGLLASPEWKEENVGEPWYIGDTYHTSIGQGFTLTNPLQMAVATAAIANNGTVWEPRFVHSIVDASSQETAVAGKAARNGFISEEALQVVREGMHQTVLSGSSRPLNNLKVTSAGKTGTAEFGNEGKLHAWYTGFAPYENPEIAFAIMIEGGGDSYMSSVPVAETILRGYFNEPLEPGQKLFSSTGSAEFAGER